MDHRVKLATFCLRMGLILVCSSCWTHKEYILLINLCQKHRKHSWKSKVICCMKRFKCLTLIELNFLLGLWSYTIRYIKLLNHWYYSCLVLFFPFFYSFFFLPINSIIHLVKIKCLILLPKGYCIISKLIANIYTPDSRVWACYSL